LFQYILISPLIIHIQGGNRNILMVGNIRTYQ
jgi:hypothetical protein